MDPSTGLIDYDALAASAALFKPRLIVAGVSCYSRHLDYARFRQIADANGDIFKFEFPAKCTVICGYSDTFPTGLNCSRT